jgi:hypothetical protein
VGTLRVVEGGGGEKGIEGIGDSGLRGVLKEGQERRGDWGGERRGLSVLDGVWADEAFFGVWICSSGLSVSVLVTAGEVGKGWRGEAEGGGVEGGRGGAAGGDEGEGRAR